MDKAFPPCAPFNFNSTCRLMSVLCIIAVLSVADRADRLFEIACLAVVFAAVMRAGVATLGALAVNIGIMSVGLDNAFFTVNKGDIYVFSLSLNLPIRFVFNINILAVLIKKHTSVGKKRFQPRIIEVGGTHITVDNSVMQRCRCDFYRRMRSPHVTHDERTCKGTVDYRKASAENISCIGTGAFKSVTGNQFHPIQCYRSAVNFQSAGICLVYIRLILVECIDQFSVSDCDICCAADGKELICNFTADGFAVEIKGKFAGLRNDTVFRLVKSDITEQFQR